MPTPRTTPPHLVSLALAVAIAVVLLAPIPRPLERAAQGVEFPIDKLVHFGLFLAAAVPWRRSFVALGLRSAGVAVVVTAAVYGGLLEIAQGLVSVREPEFLDMVAGAVGALVAVGIMKGMAARSARD